ncbi:acyltransferase family protein [Pseudoduganella sp. SL102]|uniref:acyltransferase family protein n=1 Tax=Pseudoduganella sp. SL102 TaxID=2995154 RepID=UPI00248C541E|nr:acyltransferase family protein [Pseudoduganella sp. SL102]WBS04495.1 acyltransferase family protein [Pseudoduganella sp. SL102]
MTLQRNVSIDVLKLALAFMVVGLHVGLLQDFSPTLGYLTSNGLFRIAVPIFLIINGFYFYPVLQRNEARRWFGRALGLYLFWTAVYGLLWIPALSPGLSGLAKAVHTLVFGYFHLWYLCGMIGAALLMLILQHRPPRTVLIVAALLYCGGVAIQYAGNYHLFAHPLLDRVSNTNWTHRNFLFLAFPFFYVGFAIHRYQLHKRIAMPYLCWGAAAGLVLLLLESYWNYTNPRNDGGYDNFASAILICPLVFLIACNVKLYSSNKRIALYSSGIFLVHIFVLRTLQPYIDVGMSAMTFVVMAISLAITAALIPLSRKVRFIL